MSTKPGSARASSFFVDGPVVIGGGDRYSPKWCPVLEDAFAEMELTGQQIEWLWRCRKPTKVVPLDIVQALLREELIVRTDRGEVVITESGRVLLHQSA